MNIYEKMLDQLCVAIQGGLEPGLSADGVLQIIFSQSEDSPAAFLKVNNGLLTTGLDWHPDACSMIYLDESLLQSFCRGRLELRDVNIVNRLALRGSFGFVHSLLTSCERPTKECVETFRFAEDLASQQRVKSVTFIDEQPSNDIVIQQIKAGSPTIFRGWITWPSIGKKLLEIKELYGECRLPSGSNGTIAELIDATSRGERVYSHGCRLPEKMETDFPLPVFQKDDRGECQLWLGSKSDQLVTGLHREVATPLLFQVIGRKRLILFSPDQADLVYARKAFNSYQQCWVNPHEPDLTQFPNFSSAEPLVVDLNPGQVLLIPPAWFHCAYAVDDVLSISTVVNKSYLHNG